MRTNLNFSDKSTLQIDLYPQHNFGLLFTFSKSLESQDWVKEFCNVAMGKILSTMEETIPIGLDDLPRLVLEPAKNFDHTSLQDKEIQEIKLSDVDVPLQMNIYCMTRKETKHARPH